MYDKNGVPTFDKMMQPVIDVLHKNGGMAENEVIDKEVVSIMKLSDETAKIPHGHGRQTEVSYRIAWAKTYLKKYGLIYNPKRGVWKLTEQFSGNVPEIDSRQIVAAVSRQTLKNFKDQDMTKLESAEAFERFVLSGLQRYAELNHITCRLPDGEEQYDMFFESGIIDTTPTYIEVKYVAGMQAHKNYYRSVVGKTVEKFADRDEKTEILVIFGAEMLEETKEELNEISVSGNVKVTVWDYVDFVEKMKDTGMNVEYLTNPKRMMLEETLLSASSQTEQKRKREELIRRLKTAYDKQDVSLFLGAGVSADAGVPLWDDLIHKLLINMINVNLGVIDSEEDVEKISKLAYGDREDSPIIQMRYIRSAFEDEEYFELVHKILYEKKPKRNTKLLKEIANLATPRRNHIGVKCIVTYNFDDLVEQNLKNKVAYKTIYREEDIPDINKLSVYHVHGFLPMEAETEDWKNCELVFSEEDYHKVYRDAYCWSNIVQLNAFRDSTCLFIGSSLTDPNMRRLLDVASRNEEKPRHFAIIKKKEHPMTGDKKQKELLQKYSEMDARIREEYYKSLGINILWVDRYEEIPELLNSLIRERV